MKTEAAAPAVEPKGRTITARVQVENGRFEDVRIPAAAFGYTNASWTLRADLNCEYVCRLLNYMSAHGQLIARPELHDPEVQEEGWMNLSSGYVQRSIHLFPKQGTKLPWKLYQNYALDLAMIGFGRIDDGTLKFSRPAPSVTEARPAAAA